MKLRKQQPPKTVSSEPIVRARLRNVGNGALELVDNTLKFQVEKGRLKKQKELAKEIPIADIESIERSGNELSITWKGINDRFVMEKAELAEATQARITEAVNAKGKTLETKAEAPKEEPKEIAKTLGNAIRSTDLLFDILRSLHGRIDWNHLENLIDCYQENVRSYWNQNVSANLDFAKLSSAIKEHLSEDVSEEAYSLLRASFEYFNGSTSQDGSIAQIHPNHNDAKKVILAYYILNDIILGSTVGDKEVAKESNELVRVLDDLSKATGLQTNFEAFKESVNKLGLEKESAVEESRAIFVQQLKGLVTP